MRRWGDFVWFCRNCDDTHEAASWWFWRERQLHYGVRTYRAEERVKNELRGRLRQLLFKTTGKAAMRFLGLDEAARRIGDGARVVLEKLSLFEAKHGRHPGGRPHG